MKIIMRTVKLPRAQLTEYASACEALSKCSTSQVRGDISASTLRAFKYAMQKNFEMLTCVNARATAECESLYDAKKMQKFVDGADAIKLSFSKRHSNGAPKTIKHKNGTESYDIPEKNIEELTKRLKEYDDTHPEIQKARKAVADFGHRSVKVTLRAVPFSAIPVEVNGSYMGYVDAIVYAKPVYGLVGMIARPFQWLFGV